jgi:opacity protein-like surface antigen
MRKIILSAVAAVALATPALAADMKVKPAATPEPYNPWDVAFGGGVTSDYIFRGITQSNHKPSVAAYFEPRYNVTKDLQYYVGVSGARPSVRSRSISALGTTGILAGSASTAALRRCSALTVWRTAICRSTATSSKRI